MKRCEKCGEPLAEGVEFCDACGESTILQLTKQSQGSAHFDPFEGLALAPTPTAVAPVPAPKPPVLAKPIAPSTGMIGKLIAGKFQILELVGEGGMGRVYKARHVLLEKIVCLKVLRHHDDPQMPLRFQREARSASRLRHQNSIHILDFGSDEGSLYLVMEYLEGKDLRQILRTEAPLSEGRICHIVAQVLSALAEAHAALVIHRDLKPDNIMVEQLRDAPDFVKVLDFGIAKILESDEPGITNADMLSGTPQYMSPEQASGKPYDHRSDLYAVGVILYQLAAGVVPINGANPLDTLARQGSEYPVPLRRRREGLSPAFEALTMRALEKDPARRPQSAEEMRRELLEIGARAKSTDTPRAMRTLPDPAVPDVAERTMRLDEVGRLIPLSPAPAPAAPQAPEHTLLLDEAGRPLGLSPMPVGDTLMATVLLETPAPMPAPIVAPPPAPSPVAAPTPASVPPVSRQKGSFVRRDERMELDAIGAGDSGSALPRFGNVGQIELATDVRRPSEAPARAVQVRHAASTGKAWYEHRLVVYGFIALGLLAAWRLAVPAAMKADILHWIETIVAR